ncbi:HXXEE domain-containing protein [Xanthobacter sp. 126]|uniref:HXXEE domain-containing protein n=1 Tax=Xanthobacter sp. 126 TaxID=1131814 RepID=UPI00045E9279|nr:HXXEE domain-containing protein [Xanthobacter sp. 126]
MKDWLSRNWVAGAGFMAVALLLAAPLVSGAGRGVVLIFLASPIYMLHQIEEHTGDRFRTYVNRVVFGGGEALTVSDVLLINLPGVWGINLVAVYVAWLAGAGWGLAAAYLILVNGIAHLGMAARFRSYNPGLGTGALLFIPFGVAVALFVPASPGQHALAFAIAVAVHAAIMVRVRANVAHAHGR